MAVESTNQKSETSDLETQKVGPVTWELQFILVKQENAYTDPLTCFFNQVDAYTDALNCFFKKLFMNFLKFWTVLQQ